MELMTLLKNYLDGSKRLKQYPSKRNLKMLSLMFLATKFENGKVYEEKEINQIINDNHSFDDYCLLRRELVTHKFLERKIDGSAYWLEEKQPSLKELRIE